VRRLALPASVLLLAACSLSGENQSTTDDATTQAQAGSKREAVFQKMQDLYLLRRGYFSAVPLDERPERIAHVQEGIRSLGIDATIQTCDWMGVISNGNASGAYAFGGICRVKIAHKPATTFIVCHDRIGGTALAKPDGIGLSDEDGELLLRRLCV
jgi:hypothetical protein